MGIISRGFPVLGTAWPTSKKPQKGSQWESQLDSKYVDIHSSTEIEIENTLLVESHLTLYYNFV